MFFFDKTVVNIIIINALPRTLNGIFFAYILYCKKINAEIVQIFFVQILQINIDIEYIGTLQSTS
jgi:hypothetical protein